VDEIEKQPDANRSVDAPSSYAEVVTRLRSALSDTRGKLPIPDAQTLAGFTGQSNYGTTVVGQAMNHLGWTRRRCRLKGQLKYAYTKGTPIQRETIIEIERSENGHVIVKRSSSDRSG
jgi:hypothetical protein